ncbi:beta-lactamase/transpeptidase-like protein [Pyrenochaeta sp. DS3sAY3a]|nr:beta-lactamase/transpeptidase-like protein [Pyrenochaeta sp. DS3sAY3a]
MADIIKLIDSSTCPDSPDYVTPAVVGIVINNDGNVLFQHASGVGHTESEPVTADSLFWQASQSKMMTTMAVLKTVESGLIGLDDDVCPLLPELAALPVLDGKDDANGVPTTVLREGKITLRLLLSHQSGVGYDLMPLSVAKWAKMTGLKDTTLNSTGESMRACPLAFQPGTSWAYGAGIDWAGEVVKRLNKTTLEDYYKKNIWDPLRMIGTTFQPLQFEKHITQAYARGPDGKLSPCPSAVPLDPPAEIAGHGIWSTPNDYSKLLAALLRGGAPILQPETTRELFLPQAINKDALNTEVNGMFKMVLSPMIPIEQRVDHTLAGIINLNDVPGRRRAGTLQWSGAANSIWWVDCTTGIAATLFMHLLPPGDAQANELKVKFEEAVYKNFG